MEGTKWASKNVLVSEWHLYRSKNITFKSNQNYFYRILSSIVPQFWWAKIVGFWRTSFWSDQVRSCVVWKNNDHKNVPVSLFNKLWSYWVLLHPTLSENYTLVSTKVKNIAYMYNTQCKTFESSRLYGMHAPCHVLCTKSHHMVLVEHGTILGKIWYV